jgi:hypothetical protein
MQNGKKPVDRWPFRKGIDHTRGLAYIWPRGKPGGLTRGSLMRPKSTYFTSPVLIITADITIYIPTQKRADRKLHKITGEESSWSGEELGPSFKNKPANRASTQQHPQQAELDTDFPSLEYNNLFRFPESPQGRLSHIHSAQSL